MHVPMSQKTATLIVALVSGGLWVPCFAGPWVWLLPVRAMPLVLALATLGSVGAVVLWTSCRARQRREELLIRVIADITRRPREHA